MMSKSQFVAQARPVVFLVWLALVVASALTLPVGSAPASTLNSVLLVCSGLATVCLGLSLGGYLVALWNRTTTAFDRADQILSAAIETVGAVPILLMCLVVPTVGAVKMIAHLVSLI